MNLEEIEVFTNEEMISGTIRKGEVISSFENLKDLFGTPIGSVDDKVNFQWIMKYDGIVFTIYDYKSNDSDRILHNPFEWSIGSTTKLIVDPLKKLISENEEKLKKSEIDKLKEMDFDDLYDFCFENSGSDSIEDIHHLIGYSSIEEFFMDNPGLIEVISDFIKENGETIPEWKTSLLENAIEGISY
jgi:hypothetical protein